MLRKFTIAWKGRLVEAQLQICYFYWLISEKCQILWKNKEVLLSSFFCSMLVLVLNLANLRLNCSRHFDKIFWYFMSVRFRLPNLKSESPIHFSFFFSGKPEKPDRTTERTSKMALYTHSHSTRRDIEIEKKISLNLTKSTWKSTENRARKKSSQNNMASETLGQQQHFFTTP